jgi:hypothetical protein
MSLAFVKKAQNTQNGFSYKKGRTSGPACGKLLGDSTGKWHGFEPLPGNLFTKAHILKARSKQLVF